MRPTSVPASVAPVAPIVPKPPSTGGEVVVIPRPMSSPGGITTFPPIVVPRSAAILPPLYSPTQSRGYVPIVVPKVPAPVIPVPAGSPRIPSIPSIPGISGTSPTIPRPIISPPIISPVLPRTSPYIPPPSASPRPIMVVMPKVQIAPPIMSPKPSTVVVPRSPIPLPSGVPLPFGVPLPSGMPLPAGVPRLNVVVKPTPIILEDWQLMWGTRILEMFQSLRGGIDTSPMGSGKTVVQCWVAQQLGLPVMIICPVTVKGVWERETMKYGIPVVDIISYESLRSVTNKQPSHGYLIRTDQVTEGGINQTSFSPTQKLIDLINRGVIIIGDEIQKVKNHTDQYKAFSVIILSVIALASTAPRSRYMLLSGTIIDKEEQIINLLRLTGIVTSARMYRIDRETGTTIYEGIQDLIDVSNRYDQNTTTTILSEEPITKKNMSHLSYRLFTEVIKHHISGGMVRPGGLGVEFDIKNGFYNIGGGRRDALATAIETLARAVQYNDRTGEAGGIGINLGAITTALRLIEIAKAPDMARVGTSILQDTLNDKVIFCLNYLEPIADIAALLIFYNPLILTGDTPQKKRSKIIEQFNTDLESRVLIMNTDVGSIGISLHDIVGDAPRHMIISPSYKLISVVQATNRIYRTGVKSDCRVRMFYGKGDNERETKILSAYARKSMVVRGTLTEENAAQLILPDQYEPEIEPDN
jgi:hypothetical protein